VNITVVGAGYVGLVTGVSLARGGRHHVTFVEKNAQRVSELQSGLMPIEEPGLADAFLAGSGHISVVDSLAAAQPPDLLFVAVATPIGETGEPDLSQMQSVLEDLRPYPGWHVCVRSTLPPGYSIRLPSLMGREDGARLSTNPEFLRQGSAIVDFEQPSRIVIGRYAETDPEHLERIDDVYDGIESPRIYVDVAAAELIKNVANGFLALKLSFVNEVATLSEEYGVDVDQVLDGIALDPRIGSTYMRPSLGFGGSCLPKELQVLAAAGRRMGLPMHIARAAAQVNIEQQDRFIRRVLDEVPEGGRIGLLGLSFKANTDDLRGSPAVHVARRLLEAGNSVLAYDPAVRPQRATDAVPGIELATSAPQVFESADAVVVATEWPQFGEVDLAAAGRTMRTRLLFDGRGLIDPRAAVEAGFGYRGVGRQTIDPVPAPTGP
jgi:UDPglucose 6-dehydrogenase